MVVLGSLWAGVATLLSRRHAEPRPAGAGALPGRRRGRGRHPRGDCLDRRRRALRAPPAGAGALHLGSDPGHRLRPGGRRPAGRPDRLARRPWWCLASRMPRRACCCSARCAASATTCRRRASIRWAQSAAQARRVLEDRWVRVMLGTTFLEGAAMFGALRLRRRRAARALRSRPRHDRRDPRLLRRRRARLLLDRRHAGARAWGSRVCGISGAVALATGYAMLAAHALGVARAARHRPHRPRLLHAAQHAADQRHADGARVAGAGRLAVRLRAVHAASPSALRSPRR